MQQRAVLRPPLHCLLGREVSGAPFTLHLEDDFLLDNFLQMFNHQRGSPSADAAEPITTHLASASGQTYVAATTVIPFTDLHRIRANVPICAKTSAVNRPQVINICKSWPCFVEQAGTCSSELVSKGFVMSICVNG